MTVASSASAVAAPPRRVLITNDDGPVKETPFLQPWITAVDRDLEWNRTICVPAHQQSWCSKSVSRYEEIKVERLENDTWFHVTASPASCVNLALHHLCTDDIDLVISGPNMGHNAGRSSALSSGTVGAALEGAIQGCKSISVSFAFCGVYMKYTEQELDDAIRTATRVVQRLWQEWPHGVEVFNVNIPIGSGPSPAVYVTTFHNDSYGSLFSRDHRNSSSESYKHTGGVKPGKSAKEIPIGTDIWAVSNGHVSVTPMYVTFADASPLLPPSFSFPSASQQKDLLGSLQTNQ